MFEKEKKLLIVGLGPGGFENIPPYNLKILKQAEKVFLRTCKHPGINKLEEYIEFETFDYLYEETNDFDVLYEEISLRLFEEFYEVNSLIYAVPGNPIVAEKSVDLILKKAKFAGIKTEIISAPSGLESVYAVLKIDPTSGIFITDALKLDSNSLCSKLPLLITQIYNKRVASDLKLTLMEYYGDEHYVTLVRAAGIENEEKIETMPLYELDRKDWIDYLTTLYVPGFTASLYPLDPLVKVMDKLREPGGCPWDREQTHNSLKKYLIEETYEVIEAIEENNMYKLREELGDLLLQVVFHSRLASEKNIFTVNDVVDEVTNKMIRRHPHVFKDMTLNSPKEVETHWEKIKKSEKNKLEQKSIIDVPRGLPGLLRAQKVQSKVSRVGFDWPDIQGPWEKIYEELNELKEANEKGNKDNIIEELGDLFFAIVNYARFLDVDSEEAVNFAVDKFTKRFRYIEQKAYENSLALESMSLEKMDKLWNEAKKMS